MKNKKWGEKKINIVLGCLLFTFLTSLPLFTDFLLLGANLQYQLLRIEALKDGLREAGIVLWAKPDWIEPKGFSFAFFYGDTFLYIPVLFRLIGMNVQMSYRLFLVLINAATAFGAYAAFRRVFRDDYTGLLGSVLYTMSIYRVFLIYAEAELGEILSLIFLPFVFVGICVIFRNGEKGRFGDCGWLWLSLGLSGMLRSHILSFCIAVLFLSVFAVIHFGSLKKASVREELLNSFLTFVLINLNYFYGIMQYIKIGRFVINPVSGVPIQSKGVQIVQFFMGFYQAGGNREFGMEGVGDAAPIGLGLVFLVAIMVFCYFVFVYSEDFQKEEKKKGYIALGLGFFACFLSTLCFPWDSILKWSELASSLVSMIQAPWHFLQIGLLAFSALGCITYRMAKKKYGDFYSKIYGLGLAGLGGFSSSYLIANLLFYYGFVRVETSEELWIPVMEEGKEAAFSILASDVQVFKADIAWYALTVIGMIMLIRCILYIVKKKQKQ